MDRKIVLATTNRGKLREFQNILSDWNLLSIDNLVPDFHVVEGEESYVENAIIKAKKASELTGLPAIADDSGIEVEALNGRPGVLSARYGGEELSTPKRNQKLLNELKSLNAIKPADRQARYRAVIVFLEHPAATPIITEATVEGRISFEEKGTNGFGYDPVFEVTDSELQSLDPRGPPLGSRTMAELPLDLKNRLSHRGRAIEKLKLALLKS